MTAAAARRPRHALALPRVIGHRGASGLAPENTPASFRKSAELGVGWVEFDVHLTADGVPVVIHDDTVDRTTDGKGKVAALSLAELKRLDAGTWFDPGARGERIPTLAEMLNLLRELALGAVVEIKPSPGAEIATAEATVTLLREHWPQTLPPPLVSSFERAALERAHLVAPGVARGFLVRSLPQNWQDEVDRLGCSAVHVSHQGLRPEHVADVSRVGLPVFAYTVNDARRARELFSWGVAAVFSDRPDLVLPVAGI